MRFAGAFMQTTAATAFSILLFTGTSKPSGFFLKKKPPFSISKWQHMNRKCSRRDHPRPIVWPGMVCMVSGWLEGQAQR
jgi:hypothetical protein